MDLEPQESRTDSEGELISHPPSLEDLVELCRELNKRGAQYVVVGGFAIRAAGYVRETRDVDEIFGPDGKPRPLE